VPSLRLSNPFRRGADRPSLKERAASLRATAERVMRPPAVDDDVEGQGVALAHEVVRYFGAGPIDPTLNGDTALRDQAQAFLRAAAPAAHPGSSVVEAELIALAAEYEGFARASDDATALEDKTGLPLPRLLDNAIDRVRHFTNVGREDTVRRAMALPATTLLAFGLKAQILEHDAGAVWGDHGDDVDIVRCRAFLQAVIAAAGLSPIRWPEVTPDEIRGWLSDPTTAPNADKAGA
jgi:hypothetical protein